MNGEKGFMGVLEKKCSCCGQVKDVYCFSPTKRDDAGGVKYRHSQCTDCRTVNNRKGKPPKKFSIVDKESSTKECQICLTMLSFDKFSPSVRGSAGLGAYCRDCAKVKYYDKDYCKITTQRYRDNNREWWRALHRINQFNRRSKIKAVDDGTVTAEFVATIYASEVCYWCGLSVLKEDRTLEHIIELSSGGEHSASNITMACFSCNSKRLNRNVKG